LGKPTRTYNQNVLKFHCMLYSNKIGLQSVMRYTLFIHVEGVRIDLVQ